MKEAFILGAVAIAIYFYFDNSTSSSSHPDKATPALSSSNAALSTQPVTITSVAPSSYNRWKNGPNAQTEFEPFAPSEQATWNPNPGYTISGPMVRR